MISGATVLYRDERPQNGYIFLEAQFYTDGGEAEDLPDELQDHIDDVYSKAMGRRSSGLDQPTRSLLNLPLIHFQEKGVSRRGVSPANELAAVLSEVLDGKNVEVLRARDSFICERLEAA